VAAWNLVVPAVPLVLVLQLLLQDGPHLGTLLHLQARQPVTTHANSLSCTTLC
jgi:hypothetical protein